MPSGLGAGVGWARLGSPGLGVSPSALQVWTSTLTASRKPLRRPFLSPSPSPGSSLSLAQPPAPAPRGEALYGGAHCCHPRGHPACVFAHITRAACAVGFRREGAGFRGSVLYWQLGSGKSSSDAQPSASVLWGFGRVSLSRVDGMHVRTQHPCMGSSSAWSSSRCTCLRPDHGSGPGTVPALPPEAALTGCRAVGELPWVRLV